MILKSFFNSEEDSEIKGKHFDENFNPILMTPDGDDNALKNQRNQFDQKNEDQGYAKRS